jgi:hypothetical protein
MGQLPTQALQIGYYLNLLTSEYRTAPEFNDWLYAVLSIANDISNCLQFVTSAFDLDFAVGAQLDILGQIVGVARLVPFQPSDGVSPILDDATYRILLKATIANNQWDGTLDSLYPIWKSLFPAGQIAVIDNQNMTATIILSGSFTSILLDLITNDFIIPRPQAVQYTYEFGAFPYFGFGPANTYIAGFGVGSWT